MKKIVIFCFIAVSFFSCILNNGDREKEKREQQKKEKSRIIDGIVSKYSITYMWDTINYSFSADFRPVISSNYQLIDNNEITDIYERDSCMYVSIKAGSGFYNDYFFDFPISYAQENILKSKDNNRVLVVSITDIRKIKFTLEGEYDEFGISINLENSSSFIGKGKLIDIISTTKK